MGAKAVKQQELIDDTGPVLNDAQATTFRALSASANYLALDKPDVAFASKELCRKFNKPTSTDVTALKKVVRYLVHAPRLVYKFGFEDDVSTLTCCVDTGFAGCVHTRGAPLGGCFSWGRTRSGIGARRRAPLP